MLAIDMFSMFGDMFGDMFWTSQNGNPPTLSILKFPKHIPKHITKTITIQASYHGSNNHLACYLSIFIPFQVITIIDHYIANLMLNPHLPRYPQLKSYFYPSHHGVISTLTIGSSRMTLWSRSICSCSNCALVLGGATRYDTCWKAAGSQAGPKLRAGQGGRCVTFLGRTLCGLKSAWMMKWMINC